MYRAHDTYLCLCSVNMRIIEDLFYKSGINGLSWVSGDKVTSVLLQSQDLHADVWISHNLLL